jgi:hypothetical protein
MAAARPLCLHCERRRSAAGAVLCRRCHACKAIRILYTRRRNWTPRWEAHLRRLTERAKQRLPLFDNEPPGAPP